MSFAYDMKLRGFRVLRAAAERVGLQVVPRTFYSPIPVLRTLPQGVWERRSELRGIHFDLDEQLAWLRANVGEAMHEYAPVEAGGYTIDNGSYGRVGADMLYGFVRGLKPRRIVELGSGQSTLIMSGAIARNLAEGVETELRTFDPFPSVARPGLPGLAALEPLRAQDVPLEVFTGLEAGDLLFVDTTHTVKIDSDVNRIVLDVLPVLAPGVIVHVHDIFLPYEYPRAFAEESALHWAEQYLLQAFLSGNPYYEILAAAYALCRDRPEAMAELAPTWRPGALPSAIWLRKTG